MEFAPKFLIQFMSKLVKPDTSDVLSTSTTVSSVFAVSLTKNFDVLQKCMCPGFCKAYSHVWNTHKQFLFYMYISVKMATVVGAINSFIPLGYVHLACPISMGSKFIGLDIGLETFGIGIGLKDLWPWPRMPLALSLAMASKTSGLCVVNAVLEHIPAIFIGHWV